MQHCGAPDVKGTCLFCKNPSKNHIIILYIFQWKWNAKMTIPTKIRGSCHKPKYLEWLFLHTLQPYFSNDPLWYWFGVSNWNIQINLGHVVHVQWLPQREVEWDSLHHIFYICISNQQSDTHTHFIKDPLKCQYQCGCIRSHSGQGDGRSWPWLSDLWVSHRFFHVWRHAEVSLQPFRFLSLAFFFV